MEYYSALQKKEILPFVTIWMSLEDIMLIWNKPDTERQIAHDLTYTWNSKRKEKKVYLKATESRMVVPHYQRQRRVKDMQGRG